MINVRLKMCAYTDCTKQPYFNKEGLRPLYCFSHKLNNMINVQHKKCIHEGCKTRPHFNYKGEIHGLYCSLHRLNDMINIVDKRCSHEGCCKSPNFNKEGATKGLYCNEHKLPYMTNIKARICIFKDCKTQACFNRADQTKALYCTLHRLDGMIDIKNVRCIFTGCLKQPQFNISGEKKALYCNLHRSNIMVDVKNKRCKSTWCSTYVRSKYDGYCLRCFMHLFPDKPVCRNYKTKEYSVVEYVKAKYPHPWISDKAVGGCSRRRPDLLLDLMDQVIIVEIDENQHIEYDCSCENKRIMELSQDLAHRPIVFIRFNPDDYEKDGTKVTSCWGQNQKGICVVKPSKKAEWEQRLHALGETIEYWLSHRTDKTVEIIQLFY